MRHRHARADHLAVRLGQALAELHAIAEDADQAWCDIADSPPEYGTYAREQAAEMTQLATIARAARIAAGSIREER